VDDETRSRMALSAAAGSNGPSQMVPPGGPGGAGRTAGALALNATQLPALLGGPTQGPGGVTQRAPRLGGAELEMQDAGAGVGFDLCMQRAR
jgi:hypothetical protein